MRLRRERLWLAAPIAVLGLGALLALLFGARDWPERQPADRVLLEAAGVSLSRIATPSRSDLVKEDVAVGDWLLSSEQFSVVIGGSTGEIEQQDRYGSIVDLSPGAASEHRLRAIRTTLVIAGAPVAVRTEAIVPVPGANGPKLEIRQTIEREPVSLVTRLHIEPGRNYAHMITEVTNRGGRLLRAAQVGHRIAWPGAFTFAPRLGEVRIPLTASAPWVAREGASVTYGVAFLDRAAEVEFRFDNAGPTDQIALSAPVDLKPGDHHRVRRLLIGSRGGLGAVAETAWSASARPVGRVTGTLKPAPAWARVEALHADGRVVLAVKADPSGRYVLPVPEGTYRLVLHSPGGSDEQDVRVRPRTTVRGELIPPLPGRLRFSATEASRGRLPVRWLIRGVPPTPDPMFGSDDRVGGAGNVFYSLSGEGSVEVPPGRYRVIATHGPEYSIDERRVQISVKEGASVRARLEHSVPTHGWVAADFHLHADPSFDSDVPLDDRVIALVADGIEFAVATDHNHVTDYGPSIERVGVAAELAAAPGVEITTRAWGHFNAYPYPADAEPPSHADLTVAQIFTQVRERAPDALIQVNHPRLADIGYFSSGRLSSRTATFGEVGFSFQFDVLEVVNGFELHKPDVIHGNLREWFDLLNRGLVYTATGNSDSHRLDGQWAGYPRTYVRVPDDSPGKVTTEQIVESLRSGHAVVSSGPFVNCVVNGSAGPGDLASAPEGEVTVEVSVRAPHWIDVKQAEVWANGEQVAVQRAPPARRNELARIGWQLPLQLRRDTWIVVVAHGSQSLELVIPGKPDVPIGFTNPVFVDVDGNGKFDVERPAGRFAPEPEPAAEPLPEPARNRHQGQAGEGQSLPASEETEAAPMTEPEPEPDSHVGGAAPDLDSPGAGEGPGPPTDHDGG